MPKNYEENALYLIPHRAAVTFHRVTWHLLTLLKKTTGVFISCLGSCLAFSRISIYSFMYYSFIICEIVTPLVMSNKSAEWSQRQYAHWGSVAPVLTRLPFLCHALLCEKIVSMKTLPAQNLLGFVRKQYFSLYNNSHNNVWLNRGIFALTVSKHIGGFWLQFWYAWELLGHALSWKKSVSMACTF